MRDGEQAVMVARAVPATPASVGLGVGYRLPVFCSALGRALASTLSDARLDTFLARLKPVRITRQTVVTKGDIRRLILDVRTKGYALADQEAEVGIRSIAVPLFRFDGKAVAALDIAAQAEQVPARRMIAEFAPLPLQQAAALEPQLVRKRRGACILSCKPLESLELVRFVGGRWVSARD